MVRGEEEEQGGPQKILYSRDVVEQSVRTFNPMSESCPSTYQEACFCAIVCAIISASPRRCGGQGQEQRR